MVKIGKLNENTCECRKEIEWVIPDFFKLIKSVEGHDYMESHIFSFNDDAWWLSIYDHIDDDYIYLDLYRELKMKCRVYFTIGFKDHNDSKIELKNGFLHEDYRCTSFDYDIRTLKSFASSSALTIICTLKKEIAQANLLDKTKPLKLKNLDKLSDNFLFSDLTKLSDNFKSLFGNRETCDTTLKVKDKDLRAHRLVLIARSSVFAATFKHDSLESQTGVINIPDCDPDSFQAFLEYLYCGKLKEISLDSALNLYYTSDKYDVQELKAFCVGYLLKSLTKENVCEIAVFADKYDEIELFSAVQKLFNNNSLEIFLTTEWDNLLRKDHRLVGKLLREMSKMKTKK